MEWNGNILDTMYGMYRKQMGVVMMVVAVRS